MARARSGRRARQKREAAGEIGPAGWLVPFLESRYTRIIERPALAPEALEKLEREEELREKAALEKPPSLPEGDGTFRSRLQTGRGEEVLAELPATYWRGILEQYRRRQIESRKTSGVRLREIIDFGRVTPASPGIPGTNNWIPIGPSVLRRGQPAGRPAISGRAGGIAIGGPRNQRVYVATADGGVWRSDDGGVHWYSTMDNFDRDPTTLAVTSLACGAIAVDELNPDRVYVGTGEGDTDSLFASRLLAALPSYRGVGPLRSDDGGANWLGEPTAPGSPTLEGTAFYQLAVDPGDRERVVAATTNGLYRREPDGAGGHHWARKRTGIHSSVVVARSGSTTTFFAAAWGDKVYSSNDGSTWTAAGTSFPSGVSRIGVAVQRTSSSVLYALVAKATTNALLGVYRLDGGTGPWRNVSGAPSDLFGNPAVTNPSFQGNYDLAIAVDPGDATRIYLGGSASWNSTERTWDGTLYEGSISGSAGSYSMTTTSRGTGVHADIHALVYAPGDPATLWLCCDGGVFVSTDAARGGSFDARNTGLATLSANNLGQHPTEPAVVLCGFQDNGFGRYTGEECWTKVLDNDGGYSVINWADPFRVVACMNGRVFRATDGGRDFQRDVSGQYLTWSDVTPSGAAWTGVMAEPLVGTPYNPGTPADAETVAFGVATTVYVSQDFGTTWTTAPTTAAGKIYSMVFASASRLYVGTTAVGTTGGRVYMYDLSGSTWKQTVLPTLPLVAHVTDIAVDPADSTGTSVFVTLGGTGDYRHVWRFDGKTQTWQARSGPSAGAMTSLLDVEHSAVVVDGTSAVYAGADIGVWKSADGGNNWSVVENGLPDAAVLDLQLHSPSRRLRAALHGRGVYELKLDAPTPDDVELYVRDTTLDLGLAQTVDGLDDPATSNPVQPVVHWSSANIKVDPQTPGGWQTPGTDIDFYVFNDKIVDGSQGVATLDPALGTVTNRVYVEVHNRGITVDPTVQVMLLVTDASAGLNPLPAGYASSVQAGTPIANASWQTVGIKDVTDLKVGFPQVVEFDLPSTMLPPPASLPGHEHYCLLALLHSAADVFDATITDPDTLTVSDRKVAQKNLHLVKFVGVPPGSPLSRQWVRIRLHGSERDKAPYYLTLDLRRFPGQVDLVCPPLVLDDGELQKYKTTGAATVGRWASGHARSVRRLIAEGRYDRKRCDEMIRDLGLVAGRPMIAFKGKRSYRIPNLSLERGATQPAFLRLTPPAGARPGDRWEFTLGIGGLETKSRPFGGSTYLVEILPRRRVS